MNDSSLKYELNMDISTLSKRVLISFHITFSFLHFCLGKVFHRAGRERTAIGFASADGFVSDTYTPE